MGSDFQFSKEPEPHKVAFYGLLFSMANIDGFTSKDELSTMFELIDTDGLQEDSRKKVLGYVLESPEPHEMIDQLTNASRELRFGVMM